MLQMHASIGRAARAIGSVENVLIHILSRIVHYPFPAGPDQFLASHIVYSQPNLERKIDTVRKIIQLKLGNNLDKPSRSYEQKMSLFLMTAFNRVTKDVTEKVWIRNTAAHGSVTADNPPRLTPSIFDFDASERFANKRGETGNIPLTFRNGLTTEELVAFYSEINSSANKLNKVGNALVHFLSHGPDETFREKCAEIGRDLKQTVPHPPRQRPRAHTSRGPR